jgi:hypothetical protein
LKTNISIIYILYLFIMILVLVSCSLNVQNSNIPTSIVTNTEVPQKTILTEDEINTLTLLKEKGFFNSKSIEDASQVVGFKIAIPSFIPDGFYAGEFSVSLLPGGIPSYDKDGSEQLPKLVQQIYTQGGEIEITLLQSSQSIGSLSGSQPIEIGERPGERLLLASKNLLVLAWNDNGRFYQLGGPLNEALDEATLIKMAVSVYF